MIIKSSEVLADIKSAAWLEQELRPELERHCRHQMADICEKDNVEQVWRVLADGVAEIRLVLTGILHPDDEAAQDNEIRHTAGWCFRFVFPIPLQTAIYIKEKIHGYLVANVMADRTAVIIPDAAAVWRIRAEETLAALRGVSGAARVPSHTVHRPIWPM